LSEKQCLSLVLHNKEKLASTFTHSSHMIYKVTCVNSLTFEGFRSIQVLLSLIKLPLRISEPNSAWALGDLAPKDSQHSTYAGACVRLHCRSRSAHPGLLRVCQYKIPLPTGPYLYLRKSCVRTSKLCTTRPLTGKEAEPLKASSALLVQWWSPLLTASVGMVALEY